ncbi:alpha/beta fold hydrolase [Microbacterium lushaniae]|uniref:Alpha/beta hydrolase n=1 Tax=Microbacterium lushaniae TaxID=2614639 RepID=A0A5J6L4Q1_9MICO|nr:alpha/beta hydrolase [Microbacterium lushaniae]QEW03609.1 alpha/beta hydrolase [Microbacterium lushaniae]
MTVATPQTFEPDGRAIPFVDEGEGPVVVLLPGRGLNISYLGTLAHVLVEEGFRIVRIGSRTPAPDAAVTMHDLAQDVVDVLDRLSLDSAWVGGHAFGGAVARTVALDHPDRTEGILLMGVEGTEPLAADVVQALQAAFTEAAGPAPLDAMPVLAGGSVDPTWAWNVFSRARESAVEPMQTAALAATPSDEWMRLAPSLPVLILQGTEDRVTVPANGDQLQASAADRASAARIDGGGYLFPMTHPGEIGMQIEDYLAWD